MNASEPGGPVHAPDRGGARGFRRIWSAEILTPIALVVVVVLAGVAWARSAAERRASAEHALDALGSSVQEYLRLASGGAA